MKFKRPKLPRCPQVHEARATFDEAAQILRAAREQYKAKLYQASVGLKGKALLSFLYKAAFQAKQSSMYAEGYLTRDLFWNYIRDHHRRDMVGVSWQEQYKCRSWTWWLNDRGIPLPGETAFNIGRQTAGRKYAA